MYPAVKKVVPGENFLLTIDFEIGESGQLDMKPFLDFAVFKKLRDDKVFKQIRVAFDTIEWEPGIDFDPEFAYTKCQNLNSN